MAQSGRTFGLLLLFSVSLSGTSPAKGQDDSWMLYDDSEVATIRITIDPAALEWMYDNTGSDSMHVAYFRFQNAMIDELVDSIGFRLRGNTSRGSAKKSFKVSFNTFFPGREFYGVDKMNLNGEHNDPSIIRSKLSWDIFGKIGLTATRAAHAAVYINDEYYGLYISVEHVDDEFLRKNYPDDSGNLWKCLYPADLVYKGNDPALYKEEFWGRKAYDLKTNEVEYDYSELAHLIDIINNTPDEQFADSMESVIVVTEVLKYLAVNVLTGSWDDYWFLKNNYYLYHEPSIDIFHLIPYDYDNTFGVDWFGVDWATVEPYVFANIEESQGNPHGYRPLAERLMQNNRYRNLYTHFLEFYSEHVYRLELWESKIDSLKSLITAYAEADSFRTLDWEFTIDDFHDSYLSGGYANQHVKNGLKEFIDLRNASLTSQLEYLPSGPSVYHVSFTPERPAAGDTITVSAAAFSHAGLDSVHIQFYRDEGSALIVPMTVNPVPQTTIVEEYDRYVGYIPPIPAGGSGAFTIRAVDADGISAVYPLNGAIDIRIPGTSVSGLVLNELMAKNDSTITDEWDEFDDWVEIYNNSGEGLILDGLYLTDKLDNLSKWTFPDSGIVLEPGGFLVVWCDATPVQGGLHTNFKLDADAEFLALVESDGVTIIDSVSFRALGADVSYGRISDGAEGWVVQDLPTPGEPNAATRVTESRSSNMPGRFSLDSNYPNPFNPSTIITYTLPSLSDVSLIVYNLIGEEIIRLVDTYQQPGNYLVSWDASGVASGIYLYRLQAGNHTETHKMLLLR